VVEGNVFNFSFLYDLYFMYVVHVDILLKTTRTYFEVVYSLHCRSIYSSYCANQMRSTKYISMLKS